MNIYDLPIELLQMICDNLNHKDYYYLLSSNKYLFDILSSKLFIKHRINLFFPLASRSLLATDNNIREYLKQLILSNNNINLATLLNYRLVVKWLLTNSLYLSSHKTMKGSIVLLNYNGIINMIKNGYYVEIIYLERMGLKFTNELAYYAALYNRLEILKYMEACGLIITSQILDGAAEFGNLNIIKYYYLNKSILPSIDGVKRAINNDQLEIVNYLKEKGLIAVGTKRKLF